MKKIKIAVLDDYQEFANDAGYFDKLKKSFDVRFYNNIMSDEKLTETIGDCQIITIMRARSFLNKKIIDRLPNLKLIVTTGMRNAQIDLDAAKSHDIIVSGTTSYLEPPVELAWGYILNFLKPIRQEENNLRSGHWQKLMSDDINGKTLGIIGFGKTGQKMSVIAKAFGMKVITWNQNLDRSNLPNDVEPMSSKEALLRQSDIVSINLILSDRTENLIDYNALCNMKKNAYLISISREKIVNFEHLTRALREGRIKGAAIDVFENEPILNPAIFHDIPNLIVTPHTGYVSLRNYHLYHQEIVEDIEAFLNNKPIRLLI